jgi:hypothetical protein
MFKLSLLLISTFLSFNAFSACSTIMCTGVGSDVLVSVFPSAKVDGYIYLQAAGSDRENLDCDLVEGHYMVLKKEHPVFEAAYSTILTALATNKTLAVRIVTGSPICEVGYVRMYI